ncbi:MFS transporter [Rhodobacteraceae bacterium CCMM004]|nr:MFS transporter [Rhodobacteraceae bacterium CCMM004]
MTLAADLPRTDWGRVLLLWAAGLGAAAQYGKVSVIYDQLGAVWPGAGPAVAFAVSLVGAVGVLLGVVAGVLVARIGYVRALIGALWLGAAMSAWQATLPSFGWFLVSRVVEGLSHLPIVVAAPTLIAGLSARRDAGLTMSLWGSFFGMAYAILVFGGLPLARAAGVSGLFAAHALTMAALAIAVQAAVPRRPSRPAAIPGPADLLRHHGRIYGSPWIGAAGIGWLFYTFCYIGLLTLLPPYIAPEWRAPVVGAMPLVSIVVSLTLGVVLLRRHDAVTVGLFGFFAGAAAAGALILWPGSPAICLALAGALGLVQGAGFAAVPQLNAETADRAAAYGAMAQTGNIGNTLGTPVLALVLALAGHAVGMAFAAAVLLIGAAAHIALARARAVSKT